MSSTSSVDSRKQNIIQEKKDRKDKHEKKGNREKNNEKNKEIKRKKEIRDRKYNNSSSKEKESSRKKRNHFGRFGIINISDLFVKVLEFNSWLIEVKKKSKEDLKNIDRRYYDEFIDSYNNCKFTNKKFIQLIIRYYDIHKWEAKTKMKLLIKHKRIRKSNDNIKTYHISADDMEFIFDDEGKKEKEKKLLRELEQKKRLEEAIYTMNKEKAEAMKEVDYKNSLMRHYYQTGNMTLAKDLHKQLVGTKNPGNPGDEMPNIEFSGGEEPDI